MNRLTLQQIEAFYWTATLGSVQKAADRLALSQPAISLRLKEFESRIGSPLFERVGRGLRPTQLTHEMLRRARDVIDAVEGLGSAASNGVEGAVRAGFAEGLALACLPQVIELLHRSYPDVHPELTVATSSTMEPALHDGRLDLAFLVEPSEIEDFTYVYLGMQPTGWVAAADFDLPTSVTPDTLARARIISNQPGTIGYRQVIRWFASEGLQPGHVDTCSSVAVQAKLIEAGTGVGILPIPMVEEATSAGRMRVLNAYPPVQPVTIFVVHRENMLTPAARALVECVNQTLAEMNFLV